MCIMKVSRERLQIIGKMIGVLREEKRQNRQNNWTQIKFCENICSPNTLKSIESGKVGRSDMIYEQLLEKLGLKYGEFPVIDEAVDKIVDELYVAVEYFNNDRIDVLTSKALKVLDTVKEYVYYVDLYDLMIDTRDYYLVDKIISEEKAEHYLEMINFTKDKIKDILKLIIFSGIKNKCTSDIDLYERYIKLLDFENTTFPCMKINLIHYYHISNRRYKILEITKELEKVFIDENNPIRLLGLYNASLSSLSIIDKTLGEYYKKKISELINIEEIPKVRISEAYANIAFGFYNEKNYEETLEYLYKCIEIGCEDLLGTYLIIADCQNHLGIEINVPELDKNSLRKYSREVRIMYNYFTMYHGEKVPAVFKQKILIKNIAPLLEDSWTIELFRYELKKLIKETNSYKDLYLFDEIISKRRKNKHLILSKRT